MLKINNLTIKVDNKILVDNISFSIEEGQSVCIIGESGSGKTLTALSIMKILNENIYGVSGSINWLGEELIDISEKDMSKKRLSEIAMIYQNPFNSLSPVEKIKNQIKRIYKIKNQPFDEQKVIETLKYVGLEAEHLNRFSYELSGGQLQRIIIAIALMFEAKLLILDEPTTSLDEEMEGKILHLLNNLRFEKNMSMLFITHNIDIVKNISEKAIIMKDGCIIELGDIDCIFSNPQNEYTKKLLEFSRLGD